MDLHSELSWFKFDSSSFQVHTSWLTNKTEVVKSLKLVLTFIYLHYHLARA